MLNLCKFKRKFISLKIRNSKFCYDLNLEKKKIIMIRLLRINISVRMKLSERNNTNYVLSMTARFEHFKSLLMPAINQQIHDNGKLVLNSKQICASWKHESK